MNVSKFEGREFNMNYAIKVFFFFFFIWRIYNYAIKVCNIKEFIGTIE